jgi:hypothetical protein
MLALPTEIIIEIAVVIPPVWLRMAQVFPFLSKMPPSFYAWLRNKFTARYVTETGDVHYRLPNGMLHHEYGPAVISSHSMLFYKYGVLHNDLGPAVITQCSVEISGNKLISIDLNCPVPYCIYIWMRRGKVYRRHGPAMWSPIILYWHSRANSSISSIHFDTTDNKKPEIAVARTAGRPFIVPGAGCTAILYRRKKQLHRDHDLPAIIQRVGDGAHYPFHNLTYTWMYRGYVHRVGGPALINRSQIKWVYYGILYRVYTRPAPPQCVYPTTIRLSNLRHLPRRVVFRRMYQSISINDL